MESTSEGRGAEAADGGAGHPRYRTTRTRPRRGRRRPSVRGATPRTHHPSTRRVALPVPPRRSRAGEASRNRAPAEPSSAASVPGALSLSNAGKAIVVLSVEDLERIVEAAIRRALEARDSIDAGDWLTTAAAAKFLDVHRRTIGKLAKSGELRASRIGKLLRFRRCDVIAFLESRAG